MKLSVKIDLSELNFEEVCKITIADMILSKYKINKGSIISSIKSHIHQAGEYYINFTRDANNDAAFYYDEHEEEINVIYDKYF